jgi:cyclophilin family peptidyl-prolyl cis-trans isomerase
MMKEKFPDNPRLLEYEFLANYAIERFENAELALGKLEALTGSDLSAPKNELKATIEKYQQELMIRRLESNTDDLPRVLLVTTEGDILVELFENHAPNTVANFIHLVRDQKFYDGKLFHLVRPGEYAMSGSPNGDGMGDAGYRIPCECYENKIRSHFRGTLSMMAPSKDRGGSQFFITQQPNPHTYDGKYTVFGRVIEGMDVVMKLKNVDLSGRMASAEAVSKIKRAEVVRARSHTYIPAKVAANEVNRFSGGSKNGSGSKNPNSTSDDAVDAPGAFDLLLQGDEGK